MNHADLAREYFRRGYTCAQAVTLAFSDLLPLEETQAMRLASSFGGGMGGLREACGAVSGMLIVAGLLYGFDEPNNLAVKQAHYARIQALVHAFVGKNGSMNCRALLEQAGVPVLPTPSERTPEYYEKRPCERLIGEAAELLDQLLEEEAAR